MELTGKQRRHLRGLAHHVNPVVLVGQSGLTDAVLAKVRQELENHELIKVRIHEAPVTAKAAAANLAESVGASLVQVIGKMVVLYRARAKEPEIRLPTA